MSQIVGILGEKGHGKDTFAKFVMAETTDFRTTHFAESLKYQCAEIWGLTEAQMHDPQIKEAALPAPIVMDEQIEAMRRLTGLDIPLAGKIAHSPREIMQFYGTEYVRAAQDDYWIEQVRKNIRRGGSVLIPDTRFPNEAKAIRELGGILIKIVRVDLVRSGDTHKSEVMQASIVPDVTVHTSEGALRNSVAVAKAVAKGFFSPA